MPGSAWLAFHSLAADPFPPWAAWVPGGLIAASVGLLGWLVWTVVLDERRDRRG
ncbi:hypothetical protein Q8W71_00050 [Methylobacterium sp. NEAU 140]|uniref:hypothetical protein n=1 Tax=Methylobacterium sp. NEAU 140 TaxID=3064945 RepID=UPI0027328EAA|nr:hypothetical protein [Methylobacterium sp. NEAU 140]MDP4021002.1 hypothetical protein [Methylobacterium sp. NEAU 140]